MVVVALAGVMMALVAVPVGCEVPGPVQCPKWGPQTAHVLTECYQPGWGLLKWLLKGRPGSHRRGQVLEVGV